MKKTPMQNALASRRGKGMDITIILGGKPEVETEVPEGEAMDMEAGDNPETEKPDQAEDDLIAGLSEEEKARIMQNPQSLKDRVIKAALERKS